MRVRYPFSADVEPLRKILGDGAKLLAFPERTLATVLFTDLVASTDQAAAVGDHAWAELLQAHHALVRHQLDRFRGREIDNAGDGFLASFDRPARAIMCACAITDAVHTLGLNVRAGLHTGECEQIGDKLGGIALHIGARIAAVAASGEVLVSSTVKDLVAGSGLAFVERGDHATSARSSPGRSRTMRLRSRRPSAARSRRSPACPRSRR